jgi:hypothetical protein
MEPEGWLPYSQGPSTGPYPEYLSEMVYNVCKVITFPIIYLFAINEHED